MKKLVAIGGEFAATGSPTVDREVARFTGRPNPRVVLLADPCELAILEPRFTEVYEDRLHCTVESFPDCDAYELTTSQRQSFVDADLICCSSSNAVATFERWRRTTLDELLLDAIAAGKVVAAAGEAAGCLFRYGFSDGWRDQSPEEWDYLRFRGLGVIDVLGSPHFESGDRQEALKNTIARFGGLALGIEQHAALMVRDDTFRVLAPARRYGVHRVLRTADRVIVEPVAARPHLAPLTRLLYHSCIGT